ncbi:MAG: flagellar hook-associated protein FlgL [Candidatus Accumulibacter sp.]|jgi:flagellar hook-associated protein 3 FlgL|nr:flagellar hook-associated protein FlgL [Accumulibacter sp.]
MRISTSQIFQSGTKGLMDGQSKLFKLQNQLGTGRKFLTAADDPISASQVLLNSQSLAVNTQHAENQANAAAQLALEEDRLQSVEDSVQYIMEQVVAGGNSPYSDGQREFFAQNLQTQLDFLLDMANSTDANGYYLFSGYQGNTKPFQRMADGSVKYNGDDGQRLLQATTSRQIAVSDSGRDIFHSIRSGNGTFALGASAGNTGTGVIGNGSVNNINAWTGNEYRIEFSSATDYTIDTVPPSTPPTPVSGTYTPGAAIEDIPGISFTIEGEPKAGDSFTVKPSTDQSMFDTLRNLITAFSSDVSNNPTAEAALRNTLNAEMLNLDRILENVSSVQASIGSRRAELESLTNASAALDLHYKERISNLEDIDYAEAISAFIQQQTNLEAAQSSFAKITSLSLFNYL